MLNIKLKVESKNKTTTEQTFKIPLTQDLAKSLAANPNLSFNIESNVKKDEAEEDRIKKPAVAKLQLPAQKTSILSQDERVLWRETITVLSGMLHNAKQKLPFEQGVMGSNLIRSMLIQCLRQLQKTIEARGITFNDAVE